MKLRSILFIIGIFALVAAPLTSCVVVPARHTIILKKDNGRHLGWYKNPHNPHHPRSTNPGKRKHHHHH